MTIFVRTVVATIVHCATHNPDTVDSNVTIRRALPRISPAEDEDSTTLALGMSAGVYLTAWEIMELADYPGDVLAGAPLKRVQAPDDVVKIKYVPFLFVGFYLHLELFCFEDISFHCFISFCSFCLVSLTDSL